MTEKKIRKSFFHCFNSTVNVHKIYNNRQNSTKCFGHSDLITRPTYHFLPDTIEHSVLGIKHTT